MISRRVWFSSALASASALLLLGLGSGCSNSDVAVATTGPGEGDLGPLPTGPPPASADKIKQHKAPPRSGGSPSRSPQEYSR